MTKQPKLYFFQSGVLKTKLQAVKMNQGLNEPFDIPVPWYFIEHPKGNIVIDGGNAVECARDPYKHWGAITDTYFPAMTEQEGCINALEQHKLDPASVKFVLFSHLHLDHTGAAGRFPDALHIVQRSEYEYAFAPDWFAKAAYIRKDFDNPSIRWHFLDGFLTDGYDLFGDGTIRMFFSPGHAAGHQSFLITLPKSGSILLTVDASYTLDHWNEKALPGLMTSAVDTVRSVSRLKEIARKTSALVVTGHDPDAWSSFKKAPDHYE
jgi:N-acyl homoserine lactone hydrolase